MIIKNLVYLSYGSESEYRRSIFSILSFLSWCEDVASSVRIIVYTDAPDFFKSHLNYDSIVYDLLSNHQLEEMAGPDQFHHRRKVAVIALTFEKYPDQDLLFIDSDTFFIAKADGLLKKQNADESFMHVREYQLEKAPAIFSSFDQGHFPKALIDYIAENDFNIGNQLMRFTPDDYSWNSGVLGLSSSFAGFMPHIFTLTDEFYSASKWFLCEQLAFSFVLQRLTKIHPSDQQVCHYWGKRQKALMDSLLLSYFSPFGKVIMDGQHIRPITLRWKRLIQNDLILEQIEIAISFGWWVYTGKKIIHFMLTNKLRPSSFKQLLKTLRNRKKLS